MYASEILVSVGELMSFPEHLSSPAWPLLASLSAFWLRVSEKLSSLGQRDGVTLRHGQDESEWQKKTRARKTNNKKKNQHISRSFIFATFFNDSIWYQLSASQHQSPSHSRSRESHESCSWTSQYSGGVLLWSLDTVGACQVAVSRATVRSRTAASFIQFIHTSEQRDQGRVRLL